MKSFARVLTPTKEQGEGHTHDHSHRENNNIPDINLKKKKILPKEMKQSESKKNKIPKILSTLHSDVKDAKMLGVNSERRTDIDFVVDEKGISQIYKGHSKNDLSTRNERHLPDIKLDKYSVRTNEFLKVDDDPRSGRFLPFN